ncbi:MAG: AIR synthase-related protein [Metallibacterium scheffleri]
MQDRVLRFRCHCFRSKCRHGRPISIGDAQRPSNAPDPTTEVTVSSHRAANGFTSAGPLVSHESKSAARHMRDPTRGGLAATMNEIADQSGVGVLLDEAAIPLRPEVAAACELLGLDPLNVANEGKLV